MGGTSRGGINQDLAAEGADLATILSLELECLLSSEEGNDGVSLPPNRAIRKKSKPVTYRAPVRKVCTSCDETRNPKTLIA